MTLQLPHQGIRARDARERFLVSLLDSLWARYRSRMEYVRRYERMIQGHGAVFRNDHIAFRTIAAQKPAAGIFRVSRVFEALGYTQAGCYEFPDKHLSSIHYRHPNPEFPKLFVSELKSWELSARGRGILARALASHRAPLTDQVLAALRDPHPAQLKALIRFFEELPWDVPSKKDVLELDKESQFGAWVLVNGYDVNHFTASVDSHGVPALGDIDRTVAAMKEAGIPMKPEIEGRRGSKLRQSSTLAVVRDVVVRDGPKLVTLPWTYAYFELAERPRLRNPVTRNWERFEGFLGGQAAQLFEMTSKSSLTASKIGL